MPSRESVFVFANALHRRVARRFETQSDRVQPVALCRMFNHATRGQRLSPSAAPACPCAYGGLSTPVLSTRWYRSGARCSACLRTDRARLAEIEIARRTRPPPSPPRRPRTVSPGAMARRSPTTTGSGLPAPTFAPSARPSPRCRPTTRRSTRRSRRFRSTPRRSCRRSDWTPRRGH
jgi:hypothetical protein